MMQTKSSVGRRRHRWLARVASKPLKAPGAILGSSALYHRRAFRQKQTRSSGRLLAVAVPIDGWRAMSGRKRCPNLMPERSEIEIRPLFEAEDFRFRSTPS